MSFNEWALRADVVRLVGFENVLQRFLYSIKPKPIFATFAEVNPM